MTNAHNNQKRVRKSYGKIREVAEMPNLIEVQRSSYDIFLKSGSSDTPLDRQTLVNHTYQESNSCRLLRFFKRLLRLLSSMTRL